MFNFIGGESTFVDDTSEIANDKKNYEDDTGLSKQNSVEHTLIQSYSNLNNNNNKSRIIVRVLFGKSAIGMLVRELCEEQ